MCISLPWSARISLAAPARSRSGFTLVELLVAVVIASIVAGVIFQALVGQTRFARSQVAREEVQQNARVALDVITSELRGIGVGGITEAGPSAIRFRSPRAWGAICNLQGSSLAVLFPAGVGATFRVAQNDSLAVVPMPGAPIFMPDVPDATSSSAADALNRCNATLNPKPLAQAAATNEARARVFTAAPAVAAAGTMVYVYDVVRYDVNTSNVPGVWIRRNSQPLAGPVLAATGLQFSYRLRNNSQTSNPTVAERDLIVAVGVTVRMESQAKFNNEAQRDTGSTTVFLRNRN
jgi:prepilin-type N-terminal cleavage/methylation domain-containing protein